MQRNGNDNDESVSRKPQDAWYDIVIVGGGPSAMGLLYGLLSHISQDENNHEKKKKCRIAIVDRGGGGNRNEQDGSTLSHWFREAHSKHHKHTLLKKSTPQTQLNRRVVDIPVGMGWGGGSRINAGLVTLADFEHDFETWPGQWKHGRLMKENTEKVLRGMRDAGALQEWSNKPNLSKYQSTAKNVIAVKSHSQDCNASNVKVTYHPSFLLSAKVEHNHNHRSISRRTYSTIRANYYDALVAPLVQRFPHLQSNVTFFNHVTAQRILFDRIKNKTNGFRATGVLCTSNTSSEAGNVGTERTLFSLHANKEVVLCAGAIYSPALLLVSAGTPQPPSYSSNPESDSNQEKEAPSGAKKYPLPGTRHNQVELPPAVGQNLRDHFILPRAFVTPPSFSRLSVNSNVAWYMVRITKSKDDTKLEKEDSSQIQRPNHVYQVTFTDGVISTHAIPHFLASIFRRGCAGYHASLFVTIKTMLQLLLLYTPLYYIIQRCTRTVNVSVMNPSSKGSISLSFPQKNHHPVTSSGSGGKDTIMSSLLLLDDVDIHIDPGYLHHTKDLQSLEIGWNFAETLVRQKKLGWRSWCLEVLPGVLYRGNESRMIRLVWTWSKRVLKKCGEILGFAKGEYHCIGNTETEFAQENQSLGGGEYKHGGRAAIRNQDAKGKWLQRYAQDFLLPYYHWCGTCAMGGDAEIRGPDRSRMERMNDPKEEGCPPSPLTNAVTVPKTDPRVKQHEYVVNERLEVTSIEQLRICDASVFPTCISSPTALTCAAMGCALADVLVEEDGILGGERNYRRKDKNV